MSAQALATSKLELCVSAHGWHLAKSGSRLRTQLHSNWMVVSSSIGPKGNNWVSDLIA